MSPELRAWVQRVWAHVVKRKGVVLAVVSFLVLRRLLRSNASAAKVASQAATKVAQAPPEALPFSEFLQKVQGDQVLKVLLSQETLTVFLKEHGLDKPFVTRPTTVHHGVVDLLHEKGVAFDQVFHKPFNASNLLLFLFPVAYIGIIGAVLMKFYNQTSGGDVGNLNSSSRNQRGGAKAVRFTDVAGIDSAKSLVEEVSDFLKNPAKYESVGARLPTGILLVGPPGTGKTMLARAIANDAGLPFFYCSGSDFVEVFAGRGAGRVRRLFEKATRAAPSMIFFDEIDALGRSRGGGGGLHTNEEREQTLNQLLSSMDGFDSEKKVVVMAATNRYDILDKALTRPGRFDRVVHVPLPDERGREAILNVHVKRNRMLLDEETDLQLIAQLSPGLAGAELSMIVNEAAIRAAREGRVVLNTDDFLLSLEEFKSSRKGGAPDESGSARRFLDAMMRGSS